MELVPYIFFWGRCEEALAFYAQVLGGTYEVTKVADSPMRDLAPPEAQDSVMHAKFTAPGLAFMASDGRERKPVDPEAGNVSLALTAATPDDGQRLFDALSDGGSIEMPYAKSDWGAYFGMLNDRFGTQWMVQAE